ncbi:MAG: hypothetical protein A3B81_00200 [Candidatus Muproteobacteria bacterium RIFCSPHIGHO2_02_FULL_65_16]|uniref:Peptidyl-prolyl cis-trans isomerase n=1 Tax=Candidatus Muproteobacteria bacterium RIFCSPHIGHO2_02_FULL_65_16 TaxID=1817766 RepID=A0A1F6TWX8_9PROT|nr:MAG: hypothetical protein A3B81_00200 [Candidatus Muproteobacteria bacterium RIFCSPHIGHO2_02_FULL_65_16]
MKRLFRLLLIAAVASATISVPAAEKVAKPANPKVRITTSLGAIELELDAGRAPETVKNFLNYARAGYYNGTIFHRVIPGFMIQGGGFTPGLKQKPARAPIRNEADNGLQNRAGAIAMARTPDPHSATAQFFINTVDNPLLDHRDKSFMGWGYCVFGKVVRGMEVVKKIEAVPTTTIGPLENVPAKDVVIRKVELIRAK